MTAPHSYDIGDRVKIDATFYDDAGVAVDPTTVTLGISYPDGTSEVVEKIDLLNEAAGYYSLERTVTMSGKHRYRWIATGPGAGAEEGYYWGNLNSLADVTT